QIERQAQRIEVARTDCRPLIISQCNLAVQRASAILMNFNAVAEQVVVENSCAELGDRHVGLTLQNQTYAYATPGCVADLAQQPVAGKEISVGNQQPRASVTDGLQIMLFDVVGVMVI